MKLADFEESDLSKLKVTKLALEVFQALQNCCFANSIFFLRLGQDDDPALDDSSFDGSKSRTGRKSSMRTVMSVVSWSIMYDSHVAGDPDLHS